MKIILAKNYDDYQHYIRENSLPRNQAIFATSADKLRGLILSPSDIIYVRDYELNPVYDKHFFLILNSRIRLKDGHE